MVVGVLLLLESCVIAPCVLSMAGVLLVVASVLLVMVGVAKLQKTMPNIMRHGLEAKHCEAGS